MRFVLDANVVGAFLLPDESNPAADAAIGNLAPREAIAPSHMPLEAVTILVRAYRRKRVSRPLFVKCLAALERLVGFVEIDTETVERSCSEIATLAERHQLSAYDAAYLELAQRRGIPLATLDTRLVEAARAAGVALIAG